MNSIKLDGGGFCDDCRNALILDKLIDERSQSSSSITDQSLQTLPESKRGEAYDAGT
jgi:hypothetical protein